MNNEIRNQVIERLRNYPELIQKRDILRYELEHPTMVSDDEMMDAKLPEGERRHSSRRRFQ